MALLYIANKFIDNSGVTFTEAKTNTEKAISTYTKFKYEQGLLGFEFSLYIMVISVLTKIRLPVRNFNGCNYNYSDSIKNYLFYGNVLVLPFTLYKTIQYINSKNIKFIQFE
jgi:hypothetical protein